MHALFCSAEIKVSIAIGSNSSFSLEALSTGKDIVLSVVHGASAIYLCNINVMNAMNNEIFYAESVITYLKASCCFPLVTMWKCSSTSIPFCHCTFANSNIISVTVPSPSQNSACSGIAARASGRLGKARGAQLFGQHLLDAANKPKGGWVDTTVGSNSQAPVFLRSCVIIYYLMLSGPTIFVHSFSCKNDFKAAFNLERADGLSRKISESLWTG